MAKQTRSFHYLRTSTPRGEPRKYLSVEGVLAAMTELMQLQDARGFVTAADPDNKRTSRHPDGRVVQFWAEDEYGGIIG